MISEEHDPALDRAHLVRSSVADIRNFYKNRSVNAGTAKKPNPQPLGDVWLKHPARRTYQGVVFAPLKDVPGYFNLWRGFTVQPAPGDWSLFEAHIRINLCRNNDECFTYMKAWMAHGVQHPDAPPESAAVLRGPRGAGKGAFARTYGGLFGQHYVQISNAKHLTGAFNGHLQDATVVFADEAFGVDDKQATSVLKGLITEPQLPLERKFRDVIMIRNVVHLIVASNESWVVPAGLDERRFFVLDVGEARAQDTVYFGAIAEQMANGGLAAMLYDLQRYDLSRVDLRRPPQTAALQEQKHLSMSPIEQWWFEKLWDGRLLPQQDSWEQSVARDLLYQDFVDSTGSAGQRRAGARTSLGMHLRRLLPPGYPGVTQQTRPGPEGGQRRIRLWTFPPLAECREHFDRMMRFENPWPAAQNDDSDEHTLKRRSQPSPPPIAKVVRRKAR